MTDRPILFSAPMIRALLAGRKWQTRRVLKETERYQDIGLYLTEHPLRYEVGDCLWVREPCHNWTGVQTWKRTWLRDADESACRTASTRDRPGRRAGMHMPRGDSRLTLIVTDVRVQRVQEIEPEDAEAEGVKCDMSARTFVDHFRVLWDSLNAKRGFGWSANPWVVALTFTVEKANIDSLPRAA